MSNLQTSNQQKLWRFLWLQARIVLCLTLLALLFRGIGPACSALSGGVIALTGGAIYVLILRKSVSVEPLVILHLHFVAEIAKLFGMLVVLVLLYYGYRQVEWIWVLFGFFVAYSAYWFGLLIKN